MRYRLKYSFWVILLFEIVFWSIAFSIYYYLTKYIVEFRFEKPKFLYALLLIRVLVLLFFISYGLKNRRLKKLASMKMRMKLVDGLSTARINTKFLLLLYACSFLIVAWANPQFGKNEKKMNTSGIDIMVAIDVSNSMLAKDLDEDRNRLDVTKLALNQLLKKLKGDRVGVVVFAGTAYNYIPITNDYDYIKTELLTIDPGMISSQGTAIGAAIKTSMDSFEPESKTKKAIVLFTDGETHEENALEMAKDALKEGIKVFTVGMGTNKAVPIPERNGKTFHQDKNGNTVLTKLNEEMLKKVALTGGGIYQAASRLNVDFEPILENIGKIEKSTFKQKAFLEYEDRFQWFLAIGIALLLLEVLLSNQKKYVS